MCISPSPLPYRPGVVPGVPVTRETPIHTLQLVPGTTDQVFVGTNSAVAYIMTTQGQLVRRMASGKQTGGDFICATLSPQGKIDSSIVSCCSGI